MLARDQETAKADGYPASTLGDGGSRGGPSIKVRNERGEWERVAVTAVEAAALADDRNDPIHDHAVGLLADVEAMARIARDAVARTHKVKALSTVDDRHSNGPVDCLACDRTIMCTPNDRPRGGYCGACDVAFRRWAQSERAAGRAPDRPRFERWRREQLVEVPQARCGHSCCMNLAPHEHWHVPATCPECIALLTTDEVTA